LSSSIRKAPTLERMLFKRNEYFYSARTYDSKVSKGVNNAAKDFSFQINVVLLNFLFIKESWFSLMVFTKILIIIKTD